MAGFCKTDPVAHDYHHEFQFFAGYSPQSATLIGTTTGRQFVAAGFDYSYRCWGWQHVSISFTAGAMPGAVLLQPTQTFVLSERPNTVSFETIPSHAVYGFGITPVGFTVDFARQHRIFPFVQIDGGIIASTERIPENVTDATALNFLFDFGGGVKWRVSPGKPYAFVAGYKFLHISNAFTTPVNPGLDNNVFYAGFSLFH